MRSTFKDFFVPHATNNFHPHILHTKRAVFYSAFFILTKLFIFAIALLLPLQVFVLPDVLAKQEREIVGLVNNLRLEKGLAPLQPQPQLALSARAKALDMSVNQYFSHVGPGPGQASLSHWLKLAKYQYQSAGENLAMGFSSANEVLEAWKNSPTHYNNLIDRDFSDGGVSVQSGQYEGQPTIYVVQHFGTPEVVADEVDFMIVDAEGVLTTTTTSTVDIDDNHAPAEDLRVAGVVIGQSGSGGITASPVDKYIQAKNASRGFDSLFRATNGIYLAFIIFFSATLLFSIFIEIKKQHHHINAQTLLLIGILACLFII